MQMTSPYAHSKVFRVLWSKGLSGVMEIFSILTGMVFIWLEAFVKIHRLYLSVNLTLKNPPTNNKQKTKNLVVFWEKIMPIEAKKRVGRSFFILTYY